MAGNPVDKHVGARVRQRRVLCGLSQQNLAKSLGLTFQQVQKYEKGANRIGASRLFDIARILDVPIGYFFEGMPKSIVRKSPARPAGRDPELAGVDLQDESVMARRETLTLVRAYYSVENEEVRRNFISLLRAVCGTQERGGEE